MATSINEDVPNLCGDTGVDNHHKRILAVHFSQTLRESNNAAQVDAISGEARDVCTAGNGAGVEGCLGIETHSVRVVSKGKIGGGQSLRFHYEICRERHEVFGSECGGW